MTSQPDPARPDLPNPAPAEGVGVGGGVSPAPSEGEVPLDEQSETVSAPYADPDPPVRTRSSPAISWGLVALWTALGIALVVLLVVVLT